MKYINQFFLMFSDQLEGANMKNTKDGCIALTEIEAKRKIVDELEHYKKQTLIRQMILKNRYELHVA